MRYLTKEWYIACQADPMTPEVQKQLDEIDRAYCAAQTRETLPDGLLQQFFFHDGVVREIITGTDLTLRIDSPHSAMAVNSGENTTVASPVPAEQIPMASPECARNQRRIRIDAGTIEPSA